MSWTYRTEVKGIQAWILSTDRLREMSGASEIIGGLSELVEASGATITQNAAGGAELIFASKPALERFAATWPAAVAARAPGLQVTQAWVEGADEKGIQAALGRARNQPSITLPEAGPLLLRSGRTGDAAVGRDEASGSLVDAACRAKAAAYRGGFDRLSARLLGHADDRFAEDIDQFGEGYVAVIHADANGIGDILQTAGLSGPARSEFSRHLSKSTESAAKSAVHQIESRGRLRVARPIVLGGDDFTIITRASDALKVAQEYLVRFEASTNQWSPKIVDKPNLTACAGVAIVKPGWPFHSAHDLAEQLCKAAKGVLRARAESGLAFHRVTTALAGSWAEIREHELADPTGRILTMNPYSLQQMLALEQLARAASLLPKGSVRAWARLVRLDPGAARDAWRRLREVAGNDEPLRRFDQALQALGTDPSTGWTKQQTTPILDMMELRVAATRNSFGTTS